MTYLFVLKTKAAKEVRDCFLEFRNVFEQANRIICERIRTILADTGLPKELWAELAPTVTHVKNRSPTRVLKNKTPYQALYGEKANVSHLVAIGTKAFVYVHKMKTRKLDSRDFEGIMVGYEGSHQYRIWIPGTNKIKVSRDVRFVGEATRNMVRVGARDTGSHIDATPRDAEAHGDTQKEGKDYL